MYSISKEMLDGVGLTEIAACTGLSPSVVSNILKHSHARNNRALLFNFACAMITHLVDSLVQDDAECARVVHLMHSTEKQKKVSSDPTVSDQREHLTHEGTNHRSLFYKNKKIYCKTTTLVTSEMLKAGKTLKEGVQRRYSSGPNGMHFVGTVLFTCLLPTIGFHVLSRTGHTDVTVAFWFKHISILHSTKHIKYQELSIYSAFFRGILPKVVEEELFINTPGRSVMKLLTFTGNIRSCLDRRGWTYVHLDELLEMLIVRHLKGLSFSFLGYLESAAAWLMDVSKIRALCRYVSGASRSFGRRRAADDEGELQGPIFEYDRNACQWRTVAAMLQLMRESGFLDDAHLGAEWIMNVFCTPRKRMNIRRDQESILNVISNGSVSASLHASVMFPEVWGPLTDDDRDKYFGGARFKRWTTRRSVPRPAQSMSKTNGVAFMNAEGHPEIDIPLMVDTSPLVKRPCSKEAATKILSQRRKVLSNAKDFLFLEQKKLLASRNDASMKAVMERWDTIHESRHLTSPLADGFVDMEGNLCHAQKARFLKFSSGERSMCYSFHELFSDTERRPPASQSLNEVSLPPYFTVQLDVMNALHYRGNTGDRGTSLQAIVTGKMKRVLERHIVNITAQHMRQLHLHIDDPGIVVTQKLAEQKRRDSSRERSAALMEEPVYMNGTQAGYAQQKLGYQDTLMVPWSSLLSERTYKDELASLHLFCSAVAAFELLQEKNSSCKVFLHGGSFALPASFADTTPSSFKPYRSTNDENHLFKGSVILRKQSEEREDEALFVVPRTRCIIFDLSGGVSLGAIDIRHGEAETRFVVVFKHYIEPSLGSWSIQERLNPRNRFGSNSGNNAIDERQRRSVCSTLIVSDDTDVFAILLCNDVMYNKGVFHVLNHSVHDLDEALHRASARGIDGKMLSFVYALAGCDFLPGTYSVSHEHYLGSLKTFWEQIGSLITEDGLLEDVLERFFCMSYLHRHGKRVLLPEAEGRRIIRHAMDMVQRKQKAHREVLAERKAMFLSTHDLGTKRWVSDARNFISDLAVNVNQLIPPRPYLMLQGKRAFWVLARYWGLASKCDLRNEVVGGCSVDFGYNKDGTVLLESEEDIAKIVKSIKSVVVNCQCKGNCTSRRCTCKRNTLNRIGCKCSDLLCENRLENTGSVLALASDETNLEQTEIPPGTISPESNGVGFEILEDTESEREDSETSVNSSEVEEDVIDLL